MRRLMALMATALIVGACASTAGTPGPTGTRGAPSTTTGSTATTPSGWTMVTISDSALGTARGPADVAAADAYAAWIQQDLGVQITVHPFYYGGSTSGFVLEKVRSDESLRAALGSADVIVFDVPIGALKDLCPWDAARYAPAPGTPAEYSACGAKMATSYAADSDAIVAEIVSLRSPADALIRTTDLWDFFYPTFQRMGLGSVTHDVYLAINAGLVRAAAARGIPVAQAHSRFMGPDGMTDPVAAGDVQSDELHLTDQGVATLARLLRELGYERAIATPVP